MPCELKHVEAIRDIVLEWPGPTRPCPEAQPEPMVPLRLVVGIKLAWDTEGTDEITFADTVDRAIDAAIRAAREPIINVKG